MGYGPFGGGGRHVQVLLRKDPRGIRADAVEARSAFPPRGRITPPLRLQVLISGSIECPPVSRTP